MDLTSLLPRFPNPYPTKFDTGPASIDGNAMNPPPAPAGLPPPASPAAIVTTRPAVGMPRPPALADVPRGPVGAPIAATVPAAAAAAGLTQPNAPNAMLGAAPNQFGLVQAQPATSAPGPFQDEATAAAQVRPAPARAPAALAPVPQAAPQLREPITVVAGGHVSQVNPDGTRALTPHESQMILGSLQPRPAPAEIAGRQLVNQSQGMLQQSLAQIQKEYQANVQAAAGDPAKLALADKLRQDQYGNASNMFVKSLQSLYLPQFGSIEALRGLTQQGAPAIEGQ